MVCPAEGVVVIVAKVVIIKVLAIIVVFVVVMVGHRYIKRVVKKLVEVRTSRGVVDVGFDVELEAVCLVD